ncbi:MULTISPECIES: response regulator [unclassified Paenibacillus]|jgi:two-component system LytT family response regulator|uniref:response regulator n=1 Tax=unclassified Paenibacillus TaxID=185978 RepID=UPI00247433ED|nr:MULTISPECIES: response regulator [unclassified Paenibacillus]MDH6425718.1 two-component system LytT family response regulator [Paenibacillus sp. PastH-4]MDH6441738.1 two-component system LytT family response regulator [Paenibacillus sp. PastF-4]MDH6529751.1 two-component system LytT family response regulator [Paenibacillus sp. PastH-3]
MIQAILVDDERLALVKLEFMLKKIPSLHIAASYTDPSQAILEAPSYHPDVIFIDIEMPEINGLQAAEMLQEACPNANIIFVTAYNHYAVEAFEINALDYILKPVRNDRLLKAVQRLEERLSLAPKLIIAKEEVTIRCLQSLRFERGGQSLNNLRWRTSKAQELFAFLLHNRNRFVSKDMLIELLWPDFNLKKASTHLYTTIYQVRQCLKQNEVDLHISNLSGGEGYTLETGSMLIDVDKWEQGILALETISEVNCAEHQVLFELYSGDYYDDYDYLWAESERQRLRTIWLHHAMGIAQFYIESNRIAEAVTVYQRVVQLQPYFEQGHLGLMKVYDSIGERSAVEEQYKLLKDLFQQELNINLPASVEQWYEQWEQLNHRVR